MALNGCQLISLTSTRKFSKKIQNLSFKFELLRQSPAENSITLTEAGGECLDGNFSCLAYHKFFSKDLVVYHTAGIARNKCPYNHI